MKHAFRTVDIGGMGGGPPPEAQEGVTVSHPNAGEEDEEENGEEKEGEETKAEEPEPVAEATEKQE